MCIRDRYRRARKKRKKWWPYLLSFFLLVVLGSGIGAYLAKPSLFSGLQFWKAKKTAVTTPSSSKKKKEKSDLPAVSTKDWQLILVNRDNVKPELNPQLTDVDAIKVDSRIVAVSYTHLFMGMLCMTYWPFIRSRSMVGNMSVGP